MLFFLLTMEERVLLFLNQSNDKEAEIISELLICDSKDNVFALDLLDRTMCKYNENKQFEKIKELAVW